MGRKKEQLYIYMYVCMTALYLKHGDHFLLELYLSYPFISLWMLVLWPMMQWSTVKFPLAFLCFWNCAFFAEHSLSKNHLAKKLGSSLISQLQTMSPLVISVAACSTHMLEKSSFSARLVSCRLLFLHGCTWCSFQQHSGSLWGSWIMILWHLWIYFF